MSWGGYVLMDPQDIERMFSTEDVIGSLPSIFEGPDEESPSETGRGFRPYLSPW